MEKFINIHTHHSNKNESSIINIELFHKFSGVEKISIGIHPWALEVLDIQTALNWIGEAGTNSKVLAIGECGIDRSIEFSVDEQIKVFKKQVVISEKLKKPLIIHCVKAYSDLLELRLKLKPKQTWIFHGFNGNEIIARQLINQNCYLSFGKFLLQSEKVQQVFARIPVDAVFLETDNGDFKIQKVYEIAAKLHQFSVIELQNRIENNFIKVFDANK